VYPVRLHERERVKHFGMDVVYSKLFHLVEIDYLVNLNTIYTADIIGVADPTCVLL
jgi:hypothetical protein